MIPIPQRLHRLTLEFSLKPFDDLTASGIAETCDEICHHWRDLAERSNELSALLWIGTGDEILTFSGSEDQPLPWAWDIGFSNVERPGAYTPEEQHYVRNRARPYRDRTPHLTYRDLRRIIQTLRDTVHCRLGHDLCVGAIIDPGPEFADSSWRYERHREVLQQKREKLPYPMHFITHASQLDADSAPYAGFPDGIPGGISFGTFLGRQFEAARQRLAFDYLWLSNGVGYSHHPWIVRGDLFDGHRFIPEEAERWRQAANDFWRDLRAETNAPIEVRGTNFSVGMDLATDGVSHADLIQVGAMRLPPCNPPWGSLALGLEMTAYLSRIAKFPGTRLPFRFYLNDPWFVSTPWYDYYGQEPFDIYVPMAASRLNDTGGVDAPTDLSVLTIDTSYGQLLADETREFTTHMVAAIDERADEAGPVTWIYPFDEYDSVLKSQPHRLHHVFAHDWYFCSAIEGGLPVNTVCSSDRFMTLAGQDALPDAIYVAPVPVGDWAYVETLLRHIEAGGQAMLYGSLEHAPEALRAALGVELDEPIEGELALESRLPGDRFERAAEPETLINAVAADIGADSGGAGDAAATPTGAPPLIHRALVSGGGIRERCNDSEAVLATVRAGEVERAYAVLRREPAWRSGALAWLRGTVGFDPTAGRTDPRWDPPWKALPAGELARSLLATLGLEILQDRVDANVRPASVFIKRHRGAWVFLGHKPDTTARFRIRTPMGAPAYEEAETLIRDGYAHESFGKSFRKTVRVFVKMADGIVRVKRLTVPIGKRSHCSVAGLRDAEVTVFPEPRLVDASGTPNAGRQDDVILSRELAGEPLPHDSGTCRGAVRIQGFTGTLYVLT